jgi:hypothetical protein
MSNFSLFSNDVAIKTEQTEENCDKNLAGNTIAGNQNLIFLIPDNPFGRSS